MRLEEGGRDVGRTPEEPRAGTSEQDGKERPGFAPGEERQPNAAETRIIQETFGVVEQGYGLRTQAAVALFQLNHGIPVDDHVTLGPKTWTLIERKHALLQRYGLQEELRAAQDEREAKPHQETLTLQPCPSRKPDVVTYDNAGNKIEFWYGSDEYTRITPDDREPQKPIEEPLCNAEKYASRNACYRADTWGDLNLPVNGEIPLGAAKFVLEKATDLTLDLCSTVTPVCMAAKVAKEAYDWGTAPVETATQTATETVAQSWIRRFVRWLSW